ncbi:non-ribosomal peptide synthetase [Clostridium sp. SHJSY1]|uniref:non-ribosomal peptide synthetase n=1 Tax=Clostridium sp. SHJSY1 TaxID=2942483 RepID=UPI002876249F|nr:non-ribosomal peptide synthetase [Clostridium sp. SHJSY1]MDS0527831.1 non-ribosomal peptide synthetase [Clostridium sp. SHJSY1]
MIKEYNILKNNMDYSKLPIHVLFDMQAENKQDNIAACFNGKSLTYMELKNKSDCLALLLLKKGLKSGEAVGFYLERSLDMVVAIFGILKAGGICLPLDVGNPKDRVSYMIENSSAKFVILNKCLDLDTHIEKVIIDNFPGFVCNTSKLKNNVAIDDAAYIIYTSGSTGKPKGVLLTHRGIINHINGEQEYFNLTNKDIFCHNFSVSFVVSIWLFITPLLIGAKLVVYDKDTMNDPYRLLKRVVEDNITLFEVIPSFMNCFLDNVDEKNEEFDFSKLKAVILTGEKIPPSVINKFYSRYKTQLVNAYGQSECSDDTLQYDIPFSKETKSVPIGKPLKNIYTYILDENQKEVPVGEVGELYIGGDCVSKGYINQHMLTNEKFVKNLFIPNTIMYRTGDLAKMRDDGIIECLGRMDQQVKIRGYRIEIGEVENAILNIDFISEAAVIAKEYDNGNKYLCAFFSVKKDFSKEELKNLLAAKLPEYMIPAKLVQLDFIPRNPNGKLDKKMLAEMDDGNQLRNPNYIEPANEVEKDLAGIWEKILDIKSVGVEEDFFDIGGNSLAVMSAITASYKYNFNLTAKDFYQLRTIRRLAKKVQGELDDKENIIDFSQIETIKHKHQENFIVSKAKIIGNSVLLTGGTGFLGVHILYDLLQTTDYEVYCIVRASNKKEAEKRLLETLKFYFNKDFDDLLDKRIFVLVGDVTLEKFGFEETLYNNLGEKVALVINSAATVKHYGEYSFFEKANVKSTEEVLRFIMKFNCKLSHISSIAVSEGPIDSNESIDFTENDFYVGQDYTYNVYSHSKFDAENLVIKAINQGNKASIFRVGNICGRYFDGYFQKNISENSYYNALKSIIEIGVVPKFLEERMFEMTPIDFCSRSIIELSLLTDSNSKVFHIMNNKKRLFSEVLDLIRMQGFKIESVENEFFQKFLEKNSNNESISGIVSHLNYEKELEGKKQANFKCDITVDFLNQIGLELPEINEDYIYNIIKYMRKVGYIK